MMILNYWANCRQFMIFEDFCMRLMKYENWKIVTPCIGTLYW